MFLRRYSKHKNGKDHAYWALVESYRTQAGSRQRIVSYLGELEPGQESGWAQLCSRFGKTRSSERSIRFSIHLFDAMMQPTFPWRQFR